MTTTESTTETSQIYNFTTKDAGKYTGSAVGSMPPNAQASQASINDSTDLSNIIVGPSGACVQTILYRTFAGIARDGELEVYGQGPQGMGSGSLKITVVTANGRHDLKVTSSSPAWHKDKFEDNAPITKIIWEHT